MSHEETLAAFMRSEGVGNGGGGAFPISMQTHRYQQPNLPHSHGSLESTQTPHFHNRNGRLSRKQQNKKLARTFSQRVSHELHTQRCTLTHTTCSEEEAINPIFSVCMLYRNWKYYIVRMPINSLRLKPSCKYTVLLFFLRF